MSATHAAHGTTHTGTTTATMGRRVSAGVIGGLAGGLVFGVMMAMTGMLPMVASLIGSDSAVVGFGLHLVNSVVIGLGLTVILGGMLTSYSRGAVIGLLYGALWWVLGPLLIMPLMLGMPLFAINTTALMSLLGHLVYGLILAVVAVRVLKGR